MEQARGPPLAIIGHYSMDDQIDRWVGLVPDSERAAWLVRLARGEPHLDVQFLRRLREIAER